MTHATADERLVGSTRPFRQELAYSPHQLVGIRMLVRAQLRIWNREAFVPDAWIIVTELCSNVRHAGEPHFELTMRPLEDGVRIEVRDHSTSLPRIPSSPPGLYEGNGRGLFLVGAHATRAGAIPAEDGKIMWAELTTNASPQPKC